MAYNIFHIATSIGYVIYKCTLSNMCHGYISQSKGFIEIARTGVIAFATKRFANTTVPIEQTEAHNHLKITTTGELYTKIV